MKRAFTFGMLSSLLTVSSAYAGTHHSTKKLQSELDQLSRQTKTLQSELNAVRRKMKTSAPVANNSGSRFGHGVTISTYPLFGKASAYDGSDVLQQLPTMNEDYTLLQQHQNIMNQFSARKIDFTRPMVFLSGGIEGVLYGSSGFNTSPASSKGVTLSRMELEVDAFVSPWAQGFVTLDYSDGPVSSGNRTTPRDTLYVKHAVMTIGNLNKSPYYGSFGKMYAPFGRYKSFMVSTPVTLSMARINEAAAVLGYAKGDWEASFYGFTGHKTSGGSKLFRQGGVNVAYHQQLAKDEGYAIGAGIVSNIGDAQGIQNTGGSDFGGLGGTNGSNALRHSVKALDLHAHYTKGRYTVVSEFVAAMRHFASDDLAFYASGGTARGAQPQALHLEGWYATEMKGKPVNFILGYGHTWEALALYLPRDSFSVGLNTSFWKNTVESIEYRHDINYSNTHVGAGRTGGAFGPGGHSRNQILAQFGVYF